MKRSFRRVFVTLLILLLVAAALYIYMDTHREDWIGRSQALHIALKDADTREGLTYDISTRLYLEDPVVYEVRFTDFTAKYYYEIDARTGQILNKVKTPMNDG